MLSVIYTSPWFFQNPVYIFIRFHVLIFPGNMDESRQRAQTLLELLKQSKILSKKKCYNVGDQGNLPASVERKGKRLVDQFASK